MGGQIVIYLLKDKTKNLTWALKHCLWVVTSTQGSRSFGHRGNNAYELYWVFPLGLESEDIKLRPQHV